MGKSGLATPPIGSIQVLQRCHPYGVEEEIGQNGKIGVSNTAYKRRWRSNAKNFTHPSDKNYLTKHASYAIININSIAKTLKYAFFARS